ncbi:MAG: FtsW/RodA/SpoVE family cell cycle protein, partial [Deltaproteobacteria bacterium]
MASAHPRVRPAAVVVLAASTLAVLSIVNLRFAVSPHLERAAGLVRHQALWHLVGGLVALVLSRMDPRRLLRHAHGVYVAALATLVITLALGASSHHPARWLFAAGLRVQPSEFATLALILALARWDSDHPSDAPRTLRDLLLPMVMIAAPFVLVARQPDLGSACVLALATLPVLVLHPVRRTALAGLVGITVAAGAALGGRGLYGWVVGRIETFLHPSRRTWDSAYQAAHAADVIASGH